LVSKEAAIEAEVEGGLDRDSSSQLNAVEGYLGRMTSRRMGEEVFLAQLHRRARLLNDGFQNQILQVLRRYETVDGVRKKESWSRSQSNLSDSAMRFSADLILSNSSMSDSFLRMGSNMTSTISEWSLYTVGAVVVPFECTFADGVGAVEVHQAPIKTWVDT
jgi:hypothetical protein